MIYIYDILLNFCDNNFLYDFYEWDSKDDIENIKRIKLIHIKKDTFNDILNYTFKVDSSLLLKIYNTCEVYDNKKIKVLNYACLLSDGDRVIAVEFDKTGNSMYKSKLLLDEEDEIAILASNLESFDLTYKKNKKVLKERYYTRKEIIIKNYLTKEITNAYRAKKYDKLKFLYQEYFNKELDSYKNMYNSLINSIDNEINDKHKELYNLLKLSIKKKHV